MQHCQFLPVLRIFLKNNYIREHTRLLLLALCSLYLAGCCSYPTIYSADGSPASAKAVLASATMVEAYLGASLARSSIDPPVSCPPTQEVFMAPVGQADANGILHFGAFAVRHGKAHEHATVYWWSAKGDLRAYHFSAPSSEKISFIWINERTIRFQFGQSSKVVRLNEDDSSDVTEL